MLDNQTRTDDNKKSVIPELGEGRKWVVRKNELKPLNNPRCEHEFVDDPTEKDFVAVKCTKCPVGRLIRPR